MEKLFVFLLLLSIGCSTDVKNKMINSKILEGFVLFNNALYIQKPHFSDNDIIYDSITYVIIPKYMKYTNKLVKLEQNCTRSIDFMFLTKETKVIIDKKMFDYYIKLLKNVSVRSLNNESNNDEFAIACKKDIKLKDSLNNIIDYTYIESILDIEKIKNNEFNNFYFFHKDSIKLFHTDIDLLF